MKIDEIFKGKKLLITGGTGSFGNAVLKKFIDSDIEEIRIFSRDEKKQFDMQHIYQNSKITYFIGDVRDYTSIDEAMYDIDYVYSAAALKQVPSCELNPMEAVYTNIIGTNNVLTSAAKNNIKKVVVLSTDKAVYPINAMGMSKALMEKISVARSMKNNDTIICNTRYGNVMASRGSVIPLFINQIKNNKDLTITNKNMTRFMMSLTDAVNLVEFAFLNGDNGDTFIQKAPACTIETLALALLKIFNSNSNIHIIGERYGEKLHETLANSVELKRSVEYDKYYKIYPDMSFDPKDIILNTEDYTSENTERYGVEQMVELLLKLDYVQEELKK